MNRRAFFAAMAAAPCFARWFGEQPTPDLALSIDEFSERYLRPHLVELANVFDQQVALSVMNNIVHQWSQERLSVRFLGSYAEYERRHNALVLS